MPRPKEVIVVGAGVIGCAVAYELARRGVSVQVVDDRAPGMGATQASAGILAPFIEAHAGGPLLDLTVRSLNMFDEFVAQVTTDSGIALKYRRTGTLQVATDHRRLNELRGAAARLQNYQVAADILDSEAVMAEEPHLGKDIAGAMLVGTHGFVDAGELTRSLAVAAERRGAQVREIGRVRRIAQTPGGDLSVETERGALTGDAVVLAAGSWTSQIEIAGVPSRVPVWPIRGQLLRLAWSGRPLVRVTWSDRCYLVPWDDGTLLVGATTENADFDERTTAAGVRSLLDAACELAPHAGAAGFLGARAGLRPATPDELPIVGASCAMPGLTYATGHYRNGVLLAPLTARLVADSMLEHLVDPAMAALSPQRFGQL